MIVVLLGPIMIQHMVIIRLCLAKCICKFFLALAIVYFCNHLYSFNFRQLSF